MTSGAAAVGPATPAIELIDVHRSMGRERVLQGIDLSVAAGRVVVLRGGNGAGKTTLLRLLATRLRPSRGRAAVFGHDLVKAGNEARAALGFLGVHGGNYAVLTALENLKLALSLSGRSPRGSEVEGALERVGLGASGGKLVRSFSSGMKKRLGLARLLLLDPKLWLLDEPYTALDDEGKNLVDELVAQARQRGRTVLMASHESDRQGLSADAVLRLEAGRLRLERA